VELVDRARPPLSGRAGLVDCPDVAIYDHGPQHPLRPERVLLTWALIRAYGIDRRDGVETIPCRAASEQEVELVHSPAYVDATRRAGEGASGPWDDFGYGPGDNPIFPRMHDAASLVCGASIEAAAAVMGRRVAHAFNAAGGLHHAMRARASGFCVYDDPAVAIAWMLQAGAERVAYVDLDVHHGDGPQAIFYSEPRVLTISLHESGAYLFPGTGFVAERGTGPGDGTSVNLPLPPGTGDDAWLRALTQVVPPIVRAFAPTVLVTQLGCDTHATDPLAHLQLTTRAYRRAARIVHELAHEAAGGRWVATGGGGYQWARVVPRAWTIAFAEMAGADLSDDLPADWVAQAEDLSGGVVPLTLSEPAVTAAPVDGAVEEMLDLVRRSSFPRFGLGPGA
jgi:acetoin utilization protein AcuC